MGVVKSATVTNGLVQAMTGGTVDVADLSAATVAAFLPAGYLDTDGTLAANSDAKVPSQKAVRTYIASLVTGALRFVSGIACAANPNYPTGTKGDCYVVTSAGKIGGAAGVAVDVGDTIFATADNAGGTQAAVGASWSVLEHNLAGALLSANNLSELTGTASAARANLGLGTAAVEASGTSGHVLGFLDGANTFSAAQTVSVTDAGTATTVDALTVQHLSSGTPAASFGAAVQFNLHSSTNTVRGAARLAAYWITATEGAQIGRLKLGAYDSAGWRPALALGTTGAAPSVGFLGNVDAPAVAQTGDAGTALVTFGLMTGTPTFSALNLGSVGPSGAASALFDCANPVSDDLLLGYDRTAAAVRQYPASLVAGAALAFQMRLTTESGVGVSVTDRASQSTLYLTPFVGSQVSLFDSTLGWTNYALPEIAIGLSGLTSGLPYDVYVFASWMIPTSTNTATDVVTFSSAPGWATGSIAIPAVTGGGLTAGTTYFLRAVTSTTATFHTTLANALAGTSPVDLTANVTQAIYGVSLELTAWTSTTARATALARQNGCYVKTSDATRRYAGTVCATGATTVEDSAAKRFVWNMYNRVERALARQESTNTWTYTTAAWRQANASSANRVEVVRGLDEDAVDLFVYELANSSLAVAAIAVGVGVDSTTVNSAQVFGAHVAGAWGMLSARYVGHPGAGYHALNWLEYGQGSGTCNLYGNPGTMLQYGISGRTRT